MRPNRTWMNKRQRTGKIGVIDEFIEGVQVFVQFACGNQKFMSGDKIRCPCKKCKNKKFEANDLVKMHLYKWGFVHNYYNWISHGELQEPFEPMVRPATVAAAEHHQTGNELRAANFDLHTRGSIPTTEHKKRLRTKLGREPGYNEIFLATHQKKGLTFVDPRAQHVYEDYSQRMRERGEEATSSKQERTNAWIEVAGGCRKDHIYGLGSEATLVTSSIASPGSPQTSQSIVDEQRLREEITRSVLNEVAQQQQKVKQRIRQELAREMTDKLNQLFRQHGGPYPPPSSS